MFYILINICHRFFFSQSQPAEMTTSPDRQNAQTAEQISILYLMTNIHIKCYDLRSRISWTYFSTRRRPKIPTKFLLHETWLTLVVFVEYDLTKTNVVYRIWCVYNFSLQFRMSNFVLWAYLTKTKCCMSEVGPAEHSSQMSTI